MLTADQLDALGDPITKLYSDFETSVIIDIAKRLKALDFSGAAWATQRLTESGALYQNVVKELSKITGQSETELMKTLTKAGVKAIKYDDAIYKAAGLNPLPLNLSPAMVNVLKAGLEKTNGVVNNLTQTTALTAQQSFIKSADLAYMQVSTGAMSYDDAIRNAVKQLAADGLNAVSYTGHTEKLDVAMRRAVLTGVAQTANKLQDTRADEMGADLVAVSAHAGARNKGIGVANHASWQGKIYSRSGKHGKYGDFVKETGYGTGEGLGGWNCRHSFYPYFEGISEPAYTNKEVKQMNKSSVKVAGEKTGLYDATQYQRAIERKIRYWKRQAEALDAIQEKNDMEKAKVAQWQQAMRNLIKSSGLDRQYVREQVLHK